MRGMVITVWMLVAGALAAQTPTRADALELLITRGRTALRAMRAMKAAFDPNGILNPGKTVPPVLRL